uniref:Uncharacterized protein n=1 Tax=Chromera velia CCMP2878 TaxID=1169474 RepID=A0A0G4HZ19_9ALVE|eukprot:Cvel_9602.t1-p1 / transcript=Cvel_9602.t1 / gene=Cvel_9602 / organism=Chromera_velia_CCMP2878 / gene_product=Vacuolar iron transporter 1, putative / transcript_product=Vacuolar iron transporter 1, putative / location=Cvel_scaffold557:71506-77621(+) / protein_length=767 / sequence_SO=supercontig / SO=protein_coding / is_pseudo=false
MAARDLGGARDAYYAMGPNGDGPNNRSATISMIAHRGVTISSAIGQAVQTPDGPGKLLEILSNGNLLIQLEDQVGSNRQFDPREVTWSSQQNEEAHAGEPSEALKALVFGGLDGIVTVFAIIATSYGAGLSASAVFLLGLANLVADGMAMGLGDYFSSKSEIEYALAERKREAWEFENYPDGEMHEMIELYEQKGMNTEDAVTVVTIMSKYTDLFIDHMMVEELNIKVPDEDDNPLRTACIMFLSFLIFGAVPLAVFALTLSTLPEKKDLAFSITCGGTLVTLFLLGVAKHSVTRDSWWKSGLTMLFNGAIAVGTGYGLAVGLDKLFGAAPEGGEGGGEPSSGKDKHAYLMSLIGREGEGEGEGASEATQADSIDTQETAGGSQTSQRSSRRLLETVEGASHQVPWFAVAAGLFVLIGALSVELFRLVRMANEVQSLRQKVRAQRAARRRESSAEREANMKKAPRHESRTVVEGMREVQSDEGMKGSSWWKSSKGVIVFVSVFFFVYGLLVRALRSQVGGSAGLWTLLTDVLCVVVGVASFSYLSERVSKRVRAGKWRGVGQKEEEVKGDPETVSVSPFTDQADSFVPSPQATEKSNLSNHLRNSQQGNGESSSSCRREIEERRRGGVALASVAAAVALNVSSFYAGVLCLVGVCGVAFAFPSSVELAVPRRLREGKGRAEGKERVTVGKRKETSAEVEGQAMLGLLVGEVAALVCVVGLTGVSALVSMKSVGVGGASFEDLCSFELVRGVTETLALTNLSIFVWGL